MSQITEQLDGTDAELEAAPTAAFASTSAELAPELSRKLGEGATAASLVDALAASLGASRRVSFGGSGERLEGVYRGHEVYGPPGAEAALLALGVLSEDEPAEPVLPRCRAALSVARAAIAAAPGVSVGALLDRDLDALLDALDAALGADAAPESAAEPAAGIVVLDAQGALEVAAAVPALPLVALRFGMAMVGVVGSEEEALAALVERLDLGASTLGAAVVERDDEGVLLTRAAAGVVVPLG